MDTKHTIASYESNAVLEQCDFIWIQNLDDERWRTVRVLEQCDFIWIQNGVQVISATR